MLSPTLPRRPAGMLALVAALAAACTSSSSPPDDRSAAGLGTGVVATNLGIAVADLVGSGDLFVAYVREEEQGFQDLNGNGAFLDRVMFVLDARTRSVTNTGLASGDPSLIGLAHPRALVASGLAFLPVEEDQQGDVDLNGDGDSDDFVLHVFDPATGDVQRLPYAIERFAGTQGLGLAVSGRRVALSVPESEQGGQDVNADGDTDDRFLVLFDVDTGATEAISSAASPRIQVQESLLAYEVVEGPSVGDLNGDGDEVDVVLHLRHLDTGLVTNVGRAPVSVLAPVGGAWFFAVSEAMEGDTDLNGDQDTEDRIYTSWDPVQGLLHNHGVGFDQSLGSAFSFGRDLAAAHVGEQAMGRDLNADGDMDDAVIHAFDPVTGESFSSGLAGTRTVALEDWIGIEVDETAQGGTDLDGDGHVGGRVVHAFEPHSGAVVNLGVLAAAVSGGSVATDGRYLLYWGAESLATGDRNGDGDLSDTFLTWWDPVSNRVRRMERSGERLADVLDGTALVWVSESAESEDLNDDGDLFDVLAYALDLASGHLAATGLGYENPYGLARLVDSRTALLAVREVATLEDLNGDGDDFDAVLFLLDLFR